MANIKLMHLSDLHFDGELLKNVYDRYDYNKVLEPLLNTVEILKPDLIFVTGDIGYSGKKEDYKLAKFFFKDLLKKAQIDEDRIWIVPGNHDIDRNRGRFLERTLFNESGSQEFFGNPGYREHHLKKFDNYKKFIKKILPTREFAEGDVTHRSTVLEVNDSKIGVLPLNSAWFCRDDSDMGRLWCGKRIIEERVEEIKKSSPEIIIALLHHPFFYFNKNEKAYNWLRSTCGIILRGHLHEQSAEAISFLSGASLEIAAGASYQGTCSPCLAFFATLDTEKMRLTLEPYKYVDAPDVRNWIPDNSVFPPELRVECKINNSRVISAFDSDLTPSIYPNFPFRNCQAINTDSWKEEIVKWFPYAYKTDPKKTMNDLFDHIFDCLMKQNSISYSPIMELGAALLQILPGNMKYVHHKMVIELISLGIHNNLPHLFMIPRIDKRSLINVPNYSRLLLSARYLSAGYYKEADELAKPLKNFKVKCHIGNYIRGHAARKVERLNDAKVIIEENVRQLKKFESHKCSCSADGNIMCNEHLLRAENLRALGVIYRRLSEVTKNQQKSQQNSEIAESYFEESTKEAEIAISKMENAVQIHPQNSKDIVVVKYDMTPYRVVADVYYSYGYYFYEKYNFDRAEELFEKSIKSLEGISESWDAPYTRLAILKLIKGKIDDSKDLFFKARQICDYTDLSTNRESALGMALCTLGLKIIEDITNDFLIDASLRDDLSSALDQEPRLSRGPLLCHLHDAVIIQKYFEKNSALVDEYINKLNSALEPLTASIVDLKK